MMRFFAATALFASLGFSAFASPSATEADHQVKVEQVQGQAQDQSDLKITITPQGRWKWNPEYPAKLALTAPSLSLTKAELRTKNGDFKSEGGQIEAQAPLSGTKGKHTLQVKGKIGLCDESLCIIRNIDTQVDVAL